MPFTSVPSTSTIMSPDCRFAICAGVPSITLIINILPETEDIFTPIPEILEFIEVF